MSPALATRLQYRMAMWRILGFMLLTGWLVGWRPELARAIPVDAHDDQTELVVKHSQGLRFSMTPGLLVSTRGEELRFAFGADLRYGIVLPRVVIAPGLRLGAVLFTPPRVFTSFATVRVTFALGRFGPYVIGGVGGGHADRSVPGAMAGCGVLVHIKRFAAGVEATYQSLFNTPYQVVTIGPQLLYAF